MSLLQHPVFRRLYTAHIIHIIGFASRDIGQPLFLHYFSYLFVGSLFIVDFGQYM